MARVNVPMETLVASCLPVNGVAAQYLVRCAVLMVSIVVPTAIPVTFPVELVARKERLSLFLQLLNHP